MMAGVRHRGAQGVQDGRDAGPGAKVLGIGGERFSACAVSELCKV